MIPDSTQNPVLYLHDTRKSNSVAKCNINMNVDFNRMLLMFTSLHILLSVTDKGACDMNNLGDIQLASDSSAGCLSGPQYRVE